jgi:hypothetical protein
MRRLPTIPEIIELQRRGVYAISSTPDEILRELRRRENNAKGCLNEEDCRTCGYMKAYGHLYGNRVQQSCAGCNYMAEARLNDRSLGDHGSSKPNIDMETIREGVERILNRDQSGFEKYAKHEEEVAKAEKELFIKERTSPIDGRLYLSMEERNKLFNIEEREKFYHKQAIGKPINEP